jgi:phosphomannomutase
MATRIHEVMEQSGVRFGTSGARGLVSAMTDRVCYAYTRGFLQMLCERGEVRAPYRAVVAGDRRASTPRIMVAAAAAARDLGFELINAGLVPSPAVALFGFQHRIPAIMVTGSHIPDDRNGIKFNKPTGELLKSDEGDLLSQQVEIPDDFDATGALRLEARPVMAKIRSEVASNYVDRWVNAAQRDALRGKRIVVFGHSAVGREILVEVYEKLGAEVIRAEWSERFVSVDTEAIRPEDTATALRLAGQYQPFAIVSTDGDSDRPLIADEQGNWLRGDVIGVVAARWLRAEVVVTPVSSNTVVDLVGSFKQVRRTQIGSPYVIAAMDQAVKDGYARVVGYEANGGFLTATSVEVPLGATLTALPTRDPIVVQLGVLLSAVQQSKTIGEIMASLPARYTASDRLTEFPTSVSQSHIAELTRDGNSSVAKLVGSLIGTPVAVDLTDGLRVTGESGDTVHLRPSGNAPELRCYAESSTAEHAWDLTQRVLERCRAWVSTTA